MQNSIGLLNFRWSWDNFGAVLTAYALYKLIQTDNIIVEFADTTNHFYLLQTKKNKNIVDFTKKNLTSNIMFKEKNLYITGSDQVFRNANNRIYLLDFVKPDSKKIAFSASFGVDKEQFLKENSKETLEHMKNSLQSFDFVSVREKSGVEICKDVLGVDAKWIIDPVFILKKDKWNELINKSNKTEKKSVILNLFQNLMSKQMLKQVQHDKYSNKIVSYVLDTNQEYKKAYNYLKNKYNTTVVKTANSNVSVEGWLKSIRDCKLFITDSFHGMCFALIFNKPFICIANKTRGRARFESICEMLGIENQCINSIDEIYEKDCVFKIDYELVNKRIEEERQRGLDFLKKALETPCSKKKEKQEVREKYLEEKICELEKQSNLKYQIKQNLRNLWLVIWYKYLPKPMKSFINIFRRKKNA